MGDDLAKALDRLAEILTAKTTEATAVVRSGDGALLAGVSQAEGVQKLELAPNEIKLEGVSNYLSWSRRGRLLLKTKALEGYVLGEVVEPVEKQGAEWKKWSTTDSGILAWLLSSLTPPVAASVEALPTAKEVWEALSQMYSGKGNVMLVSQLEDRLHDLTQGEKSVMTYVGELKQLWADLDHLDPLVLTHTECVVAAKKWIEGKRVLKFLKGLNQDFENRRANLMHETQLPSLEAAIAAIAQEETRLKCNGKGELTQRPAYLVSEWQQTRECFNCGVSGHLVHQCTAPPRRGRGGFRGSRYGRGYYRGGRGRNGGNYYHNSGGPQGGARANMTFTEGGRSVTQNHGSVEGEVKKNEQQGETSFEQFAHFVYTKGNTENVSLAAHKLDSDWVLDSGASRHVTGNSREFEMYNQYPSTYHETIQTADGTAQPVKGVGDVQCSSNIKLSSVLHVPAFPVSLISLSNLVDQIDCRIILDKYMCLIQERMTGRKLGDGIRCRGLWYLDREKPKLLGYSVVLAAVQGDKESKAMIHHCRMGHISFDKMSKVCPDVMSRVDMNKLKCDACEDHRPSASKLDPKAVKCIFIGYPPGQQGYKCWNPTERRTFVSMDVTFRESEPFYGEQTDLSILFEGLDHLSQLSDDQEGENTNGTTVTPAENSDATTKGQPSPLVIGSDLISSESEADGAHVTAPQQGAHVTALQQGQEKQLQVYTRRRRENVEQGENAEQGEEDNLVQGSQIQEEEQSAEDRQSAEDSSSSAPLEVNSNITRGSADLPIALRKGTRAATSRPVKKYGFNVHDISNYVSYEALSPSHLAFVASLQLVHIPTDWTVAKQDPKWCAAMREELEALRKNQTWELTTLPDGKKAVGCKWVFTVKQSPEGKIERYKARLVARGYSQTYGIDYDETFAPVAKMNTVRILISCAANFGWPLHQLDVKNAFLHGDLQEEVYMEVPPGMAAAENGGKVCKLKKALYGLKQSPRAWFDRFRRAVCAMGYRQCNGDHTVFYRHSNQRITILAVYVDDIIITGDDEAEILRLKKCLSRVFEVKDLGQLRF
ncbi:hypothetical protein QYE76_033230 [Lolium multiflorum]|uniref:CCHC-type domain-containing protein n=1 Tax=Lolium multiflorum TaxID=4521 RepID=A0AAD8VJ42_LOLMU|nr:hypothetical protein QYE76_033230 [Lolium multiflorum]